MGESLRPLVVGEVLFDHFPDGRRVLGGAPFNVAWNLQGMGLEPAFVSAVGDDDEGKEIRSKMIEWGMDLAGLQTSSLFPTGKVQVELHNGEPSYEILNNRAFDDVDYPETLLVSKDFSLLYHGSLAFRNEPTRTTIRRLVQESKLPRFVDINIRQPWIDLETVGFLLDGATWVKLNCHELSWILQRDSNTKSEIADAVAELRKRFGGKLHFITCGAAGAYVIDEDAEVHFADAPTPDPMTDSVGAGDAFSSAAIFGICRGYSIDRLLRYALDFASRTCTIQGAISRQPTHYQDSL